MTPKEVENNIANAIEKGFCAAEIDGEWMILTPWGLTLVRSGLLFSGSKIGLVLKPVGLILKPFSSNQKLKR